MIVELKEEISELLQYLPKTKSEQYEQESQIPDEPVTQKKPVKGEKV